VIGERTIGGVGAHALGIARDTGGIMVLLAQSVRALVPPRIDGRELLGNLYKMGNQSVPIVVMTAFFTGGLMAIQSGLLVKRFDATGMIGWAGGYAIMREVGPILIALMFSGRVGSNNTAELGTMTVTEQLDGLRALAIDPIRHLIVPRMLAMIIALLSLTVIGDLVALVGGALFAHLMLDVEYATLYYNFAESLSPIDFLHGIIKSGAFGLAIAVTSCYFGITVRGGAVGVGRAVNAAVVAAAVSVLLLDFFLTYLLP
jgi:phospholipid/cholesterol/gamma-HCH transport system permease protein